jgi:hypothetical protein
MHNLDQIPCVGARRAVRLKYAHGSGTEGRHLGIAQPLPGIKLHEEMFGHYATPVFVVRVL